MLRNAIEYLWYKNRFLASFFLPLSGLFCFLAKRRKQKLIAQLREQFPCPVIVVGNITVGGTGKTPLVMTLVKRLQEQGLKPGVVSRGYGGRADYPYQLSDQSTAHECGDEPLLIYKHCHCPLVVSPHRVEAVRFLLEQNDIDVVISDDGLQHYGLRRDMEIVVIDAARGLGNGYLLPAGPLRESPERLRQVQFVITNGETPRFYAQQQFPMKLVPLPLQPLSPLVQQAAPAEGDTVHAVAGIGNPHRFFTTLQQQGYSTINHAFADHHDYHKADLRFGDSHAVIMTEKDAVKCDQFPELDKHWYLPVKAQVSDIFWKNFDVKLNALLHRYRPR